MNRPPPRLTPALFLFLAGMGLSPLAAQQPAPEEIVRIDVSGDLGPVTSRASGFLHSISPKVPDALLSPLRPGLFRGRYSPQPPGEGDTLNGNYSRLKELGCRHFQIVVSDAMESYRGDVAYPGDGGDWSAWNAKVDRILQGVNESGLNVEYDIWNEPDHPGFWRRDFDQYLELWKRTYRRIREAQPGAVIVGPSIAYFNEDWLREFVRHAKANAVVPDIFSWHENGVRPEDIAPHKAAILRILAAEGVRIDRFSINEFTAEKRVNDPGSLVAYFAGVELAGAESAARSCWKEATGVANCHNMSLDGLLTDPDRRQRSTWWTYKAYADLRGRLALLRAEGSLGALASVDGEGASLLLGRFREANGPVRIVWEHLDKIGVSDGKEIAVRVERIPPSGLEALSQPEQIAESTVTPRNGAASLLLPQVNAYEAYVVRLGSVH